MTFLPHLSRARIATAAVALLTALVMLLGAARTAPAHHISPDYFPNFMGAGTIGIQAWQDYLGHCSQLTIHGYDNAEEPDYAGAYAFAPLGGCDVYFNTDQRKNYKWKWFCSVMVHEMGHSAGMEHIRDGRDIMHATNEVYWRWCLTKKQARKMKRRGKIVDRSINSWVYAKASASHTGHHEEDHHEVTQAEVEQAMESGELEVHTIATIPVR